MQTAAKTTHSDDTARSSYYTQAEARRLVGQVFESQVEFSGIPKGTRGKVVAIDQMGDGWDVTIEWDLDYRTPSGQGLRDWFTRDEMERFMRPVPAESVTS